MVPRSKYHILFHKMTAKTETTVQERVSTFLSAKILDISEEMSGHFPAVFVVVDSCLEVFLTLASH